MNTLIGLLIIAVGSFGQSSSYVPIKKVQEWSWESFWLVQGVFAWLLFPYIGAQLAVPEGSSLVEMIWGAGDSSTKALIYGALWGVGGLTFGLSMRYLGVALGQSIALGTCSAFGTLIPALIAGKNLFSGEGLILLIAVSVAIAGIAVIGFAGALRAQNLTQEQKKAAIKDFALGKGLLVALLAGVMSACFSFGLDAAEPLRKMILNSGTDALYAGLPAILIITFGGFLTNASYCLFQNIKNKTLKDYFSVSPKLFVNNVLFCALAGVLWYSQFFGLALGKSFLTTGSVMMAFSWTILMSLNISFSNVWGVILKEWVGSNQKTIITLSIGILILIFSLFVPSILQ